MGPGDMQQLTHRPATAASPVSLCLHALAQGHCTIALPCVHVHNLISLYQRACVHVPCHATATGTSAPHFPFLYCTVIIVTPFSDMEPTSPAPAGTFHLCCHCHCGKLGIQISELTPTLSGHCYLWKCVQRVHTVLCPAVSCPCANTTAGANVHTVINGRPPASPSCAATAPAANTCINAGTPVPTRTLLWPVSIHHATRSLLLAHAKEG